MAFCNRFGSLLRQSSASKGQGSMGVLLNSSRCMSSTKVFVGGLSYGTDNQSLKEAFASFGDVIEARVITDRDTGRSKGFGFVNFDSEECANSAVSAMNGQEINGRNLRVSFANDRAPAPRRGGGGYRGRGYGDGGGYRGRGGGGGYGDGGGYRGDGDYGGHDEY